MSEVENLLNEAITTSSVAFHQFALLTTNDKKCFYCFFEGKDASYYVPRITPYMEGHEIIPINCGGKSKVIEVYKIIKNVEEYDKYIKGYFVDSDFDENTESYFHEDIYVTPCYSIENLYVTDYTIKEILKCEFNILETESNYKDIIDFYNQQQCEFHDHSKLFNAWYACQKEKPGCNILLENHFPDGIISIQIGSISSSYDLNKLNLLYPDSVEISEEDIIDKIGSLSTSFSNNLRGKFELIFLFNFIVFLIADANHRSRRVYIKRKTSFEVKHHLLLSQITQYAITPQCLKNYILKVYNQAS
jgi:hypothetical protein